MFSKNAYQKRVMHSESDNIENMVGQERYETMNGIFKFLLLRYQIGLQESMRNMVVLSLIILIFCIANFIK